MADRRGGACSDLRRLWLVGANPRYDRRSADPSEVIMSRCLGCNRKRVLYHIPPVPDRQEPSSYRFVILLSYETLCPGAYNANKSDRKRGEHSQSVAGRH